MSHETIGSFHCLRGLLFSQRPVLSRRTHGVCRLRSTLRSMPAPPASYSSRRQQKVKAVLLQAARHVKQNTSLSLGDIGFDPLRVEGPARPNQDGQGGNDLQRANPVLHDKANSSSGQPAHAEGSSDPRNPGRQMGVAPCLPTGPLPL